MTTFKSKPDSSLFNSVIRGISKQDLDSTKRSIDALTSKKNAYSCEGGSNQPDRWNMITYKKGKKSSL